jgi:hypothetical protein
MDEIQNTNDTIGQAEEELAHYEARGGKGTPALPADLSVELSRLSRGLEKKQQTGRLSPSEQNMLSRIDKLMNRMGFLAGGKSAPEKRAASDGKNVYDLAQSRVLKQSREKPPVVLHQISEKQADDIIAGIDQQFQEKVVKTMDRPLKPIHQSGSAQNIADIESVSNEPNKEEDGGVNLHDYLSRFRDQRPDESFADHDSSVDLASMAKKEN